MSRCCAYVSFGFFTTVNVNTLIPFLGPFEQLFHIFQVPAGDQDAGILTPA